MEDQKINYSSFSENQPTEHDRTDNGVFDNQELEPVEEPKINGENFDEDFSKEKVTVAISNINMRAEPSKKGRIKGRTPVGNYCITKRENGYVYIPELKAWIMERYTTPCKENE